MPATTRKQQRFMYAELGRLKKGLKGHTGMTASQVQDFTVLKPKKKRSK